MIGSHLCSKSIREISSLQLAQELCAGSLMEWVSMAEQLHPSLTSLSAMQNIGRSVKHAASGL